MSNQNTVTIPVWFWVVAGLALVWNLMGVFAYIAQVTMSPEAKAALPEAECLLYENTPAWATAAFATAVCAGALGCLLLLLRTRFALVVLIVSLLAILTQMYHAFFISRSFEVFGPGRMVMPIMIVVIGILLIFFTTMAIKRHWVR